MELVEQVHKAGGRMVLVAHASSGGFFKCGYGKEVVSGALGLFDDCRGWANHQLDLEWVIGAVIVECDRVWGFGWDARSPNAAAGGRC